MLLTHFKFALPKTEEIEWALTGALVPRAKGKPEDVKWRESRAYILAENVEWSDGTLAVTGVVRGSSLSANRLVHLPNFGDYQISKVRVARFCLQILTS